MRSGIRLGDMLHGDGAASAQGGAVVPRSRERGRRSLVREEEVAAGVSRRQRWREMEASWVERRGESGGRCVILGGGGGR